MLAHESILLPRATMNAGNLVVDAFRRAGFEPKFSYRANYPELTKALVRRGLGVAPMPKMLVGPETLDGLVAIPFEKPLSRDLVFIYPRDRPADRRGPGPHGSRAGRRCSTRPVPSGLPALPAPIRGRNTSCQP